MTDIERIIEEHVFENFENVIDECMQTIRESVKESDPDKLSILDDLHVNLAKQYVKETLNDDIKSYSKRCAEKCEASTDIEELMEDEISPLIHEMFLMFFTKILLE